MAKIKTLGNAVVIQAGIKLADIEKLKKYNPAALELKGGEDGKEVVFAVATGTPSVSKYGICFGHADAEGNAVVTVLEEVPADKAKDYLADKYGYALTCLAAIEGEIPTAIANVDTQIAAIKANIEIA